MSNDALGKWYCELVDQEQSEEEADEFGDYDDMGYGREQKASKTEFANTTLELFDDGRYELKAEDYNSSQGTWTAEGEGVRLTQAEDCINGYDGLVSSSFHSSRGDRFTVCFKLNPDSHDGLDILVLTFGRTPPKPKGATPDNFVDHLLEAKDEDEIYEVLDLWLDDDDAAPKPERRPREELCAELWDAWVEGRIAVAPADPDDDDAQQTYWNQTVPFGDERVKEAGGFAHRHARHALETLDFDDHREMFEAVEDKLPTLPEDPEADAELAPLLASAAKGQWLNNLIQSRFVGGGTPESMFARPLMPQPATDEAARTYLANTGKYSRMEALDSLYPPGHEDELAAVVIRYRGRDLLTKPLELIDRRGIRPQAKAAALAWLDNPNTNKGSDTGLSAMMFALVFLVEDAEPLPPSLVEALGVKTRGMVWGSPSDAEKATLRELAAMLPDDERALVHERFRLDPKD